MRQLRQADAFLYARTAMRESGAFEVCYNVYQEPRAPMFVAVWKQGPIKTTLLRELDDVGDVTYREFEAPRRSCGPTCSASSIGSRSRPLRLLPPRTSAKRSASFACSSRRGDATLPSIAKRQRSLLVEHLEGARALSGRAGEPTRPAR